MRFYTTSQLKIAAMWILLCVVAGMPSTAIAQKSDSYTKTPVAIKPIYNPHTKSYFELRVDLPKPPQWRTAVRYARSKKFKGVRGRLAFVKDLKTHSFLRANFTLNEQAWIGLRFFCGVRKLVWVDGQIHERKAFKVWARQWHRTNVTCRSQKSRQGRIDYMPVAYTQTNKGFRWQASGPGKYFVSYFVEYLTGSEHPEIAPEPETKSDGNAAAPKAQSAGAQPAKK